MLCVRLGNSVGIHPERLLSKLVERMKGYRLYLKGIVKN
jgi:hypothetical protein